MVDNAPDISLDNVLNTGTDGNRAPIQSVAAVVKDGSDLSKDTPPADTSSADVTQANTDNLKGLFSSFVDESKLDDTNKTIRQGLLEKHKGTSFDSNGNILDAEGKAIVNFEDLLKYATEEDALTLDAEGNQIDGEGKVIKTKVELAVENTTVNKLHADSDYEFVDEKGNTKIYTDDDAGIAEFTNDVVAEKFNEWKSAFFGQQPELAEIAKHILAGGQLKDFNSAVDYSKVDTKNLSKEEKISYIRRSFEVKGLEKDRIDGLMQLFIDSNSIDSELARALPSLQAHEASIAQQRNDNYVKSVEDKNNEIQAYWDEVNSIVVKGQLGTIAIPNEDKEAFYDYLSSAVDNSGNSKEMLDRKKETKEQQLTFAYLRFKGYDLSKLVDSKVKSQKVQSLKELIKQSAKLQNAPVNDTTKKITSGESNITISSLLG